VDEPFTAHYNLGIEQARLVPDGEPNLELVRTLELLERFLPRPPASILDVGGGPGVYASLLARRGYRMHLVDIVELHVEQAAIAAPAQHGRRSRSPLATRASSRSLTTPGTSSFSSGPFST
jgi:2-polyprenyl-3-methyl-5-hydroxy-6-metoxy-1,4-benzoquinol methylase